MCGICGIYSPKGVQDSVLRRMAAQIEHRGPDGEGVYVGSRIGLANRRLAIIDVEGGGQPIANEDGTVRIVFNGEIYNFAALRDELIQLGHRFQTHCDTEVIVHLYEQYEAECVNRLIGMFAFAIWDEPRGRLFLARDHLGQKPLYYARQQDALVFGSEVKSLLAYPGVAARLDVSAMHDCLSVRCVPGDATLFEGIRKLPPGHSLILENAQISVQQYWDVRYTPKTNLSVGAAVRQLRSLLEETIESHMISDVPLGAFLSGGIDSSLIVAMMARSSKRPIRTFSVGSRDKSFNELPFARQVAEQYGTEHHEILAEPDLITHLPRMIHFMEEPVDPFAFGVYMASKLASRYVKVVLGGDGGDEVFAGYDRYLGQKLVDMYCRVPAPLRRRMLEPMIRRLPDNYRYNNRVQKLRWLVAMSHNGGGERYADSCCFLRFDADRKQSLYTRDLNLELLGADSLDHLIHCFDSDRADHAIDRMLYTDLKTRLPEHLLMIGDRMTMANRIEGRSPLVDLRVVEFVATLPANMKVHGRTLKYIQRRVAVGLLPKSLIKRRKQGFSFPLARWFKNELGEPICELLSTGSLVAAGLFRGDAIRSLFEEHASGRVDHNYRLWLLLNFELWYRLFVENHSHVEVRQDLENLLGSPSREADLSLAL